MTYWILVADEQSDGAVLTYVPEDGPDDFEYSEGIPLLQDYPAQEDAVMVYDSDYPDQVKLYDFVPNLESILVVSVKVKEVLVGQGVENIEYLPITLWDHQKKPSSSDYFILNPLGGEKIIDMEKSEYRMSSLDEGQIKRIKKPCC